MVAGDVPKPSSVSPRISPELEQICMKALAFRRDERHGSASELAAELEHFTDSHFPPVNGRELGAAVAQTFTEDRERIRNVIEAQLSQPGADTRLAKDPTVTRSALAVYDPASYPFPTCPPE